MMICFEGLLEHAAAMLSDHNGHSEGGRAFTLRELSQNLLELRDRTEKGDYAALDEFFAIYVADKRSDYNRKEPTP